MWIPRVSQSFYYMHVELRLVFSATYFTRNNSRQSSIVNVGNCFKTRGQAEEVMSAVLHILDNHSEDEYSIGESVFSIEPVLTRVLKSFNGVHVCKTEEEAVKLLMEVGHILERFHEKFYGDINYEVTDY